MRDNSTYEVLEERPLSEEAKAAEIVFDGVVRLGVTLKADAQPDHPIRPVQIKTTPHVQRGKSRGGSAGPPSDGLLRIATELVDVPAEIVGLTFQYRRAEQDCSTRFLGKAQPSGSPATQTPRPGLRD